MDVKQKILNALSLFWAKIKGVFVQQANVVNNLASTSSTFPLSANQGRVLDGKINELNSSLNTVERQEMSGSTYLPPANAYKNCKFVQWRCVGTAQKALNTGTEYQVGTLQEKFRPIASLYKYERYAQGKECQVVIGTDGAITVQFFENLPAGTAMNINVYFTAK